LVHIYSPFYSSACKCIIPWKKEDSKRTIFREFIKICNTNPKKSYYILYNIEMEGNKMQDEVRNCGCGCGNNGLFGLFNGNGCGDSGILFFIIIFLLLFTNNGNCGCGCGR